MRSTNSRFLEHNTRNNRVPRWPYPATPLRWPSSPILGPLGTIDAYISAVNRLPVLTAEQEAPWAGRLRDDRDLDAARELVLSQPAPGGHIARHYMGYGLPRADLIQEGNVGLMKAVKRFDPESGVRLMSFAVHWIKAEIHEYIAAATGAWSRSPPPRPSASCSSTCAAMRPTARPWIPSRSRKSPEN